MLGTARLARATGDSYMSELSHLGVANVSNALLVNGPIRPPDNVIDLGEPTLLLLLAQRKNLFFTLKNSSLTPNNLFWHMAV